MLNYLCLSTLKHQSQRISDILFFSKMIEYTDWATTYILEVERYMYSSHCISKYQSYIFKIQPSSSLTIIILRWPIVGFINSCSEALVAASSSDHIWARSMEGEEFVFPVDLRHGCLETLQGAGLLQAEGRAQFHKRWRSCRGQRETNGKRHVSVSLLCLAWTTGDLVWYAFGTSVETIRVPK